MSLLVLIFLLDFLFVVDSDSILAQPSNVTSEGSQLCGACETLVDSFLKGMERTARNQFGGGDTAWEEEKLGSYSYSELRLVEIQEMLCEDQEQKPLCQTLAELWEEFLENWWLQDRHAFPDLRQYLCVDTVRVCGMPTCPQGWVEDGQKGCVDVNECSLPSSPCAVNEYCVNNEGSHLCLPCDSSCLSCSGPGPSMCNKPNTDYPSDDLTYFGFKVMIMKLINWFAFGMAVSYIYFVTSSLTIFLLSFLFLFFLFKFIFSALRL